MSEIGAKGEELAARWLQRKGYKILKRNFRTGAGEIDLVLNRKNMIIFCEVKTRRSLGYGEPFESVSEKKKGKIKKVAESYLLKNRAEFNKVRFDVVSVLMNGEGCCKIEHIANAFN